MIRKMTINDVKKSAIPHFGACTGLPKSGEIEFNPRLTVLWGNNGTGKSTLLLEIARRLHCEQGGVQKVTRTSVANMRLREPEATSGITLDHDGGSIMYFDPGATVGLYGGGFDYDFTEEGINNTMCKGSAGETVIRRGSHAYAAIFQGKPLPKKSFTYGLSPEDEPEVHELLQGTPKEGVEPVDTLILDEGERSLSLVNQGRFWERIYLRVFGSKLRPLQIIVASHSMFALDLPGAKYIETTPGSIKETTTAILHAPLVYDRMARSGKTDG